MKKLLLSLAVVALGMSSAAAKDYTLFNVPSDLTWTPAGTGFTATATVDGATFTLTTDKAESTSNLVEPAAQLRVYKNSTLTIASEGATMKQMTLYTTGGNYKGAQTVSEGWTQTEDGNDLILTCEAGSNTMTLTASSNQIRVTKIVVSDEIGSSTPDDPQPDTTTVNSVAETIALNSMTFIKVNYPMTVAFVNKNNIFAVDDYGDFIQIYGSNNYAANDIIPAGWNGDYELYRDNTPEIKPVSLPDAFGQKTFVPKAVAAKDITVSLVNSVILVKDVVFATETPSARETFTGTVDGVEYSFFNNYTLESVPAGTYDVTIVVTIFNNAPSLYVIKYDKASGVEGVEAAAAEAEYFNLQGVRVANPENGVFIRVEGGKATKVVR